jgi:putative transposase
MDVSMLARVKELEEENRRLKKMYAEFQMDSTILKEALAKKWWGHLSAVEWPPGRSKAGAAASPGVPTL